MSNSGVQPPAAEDEDDSLTCSLPLPPPPLFSPLSEDSTADSFDLLQDGDATPLAFRAPWATPPKATLESNKLGGSITSPQSVTSRQRHNLGVQSPESDFELHDLGESFPSLAPAVKWETARFVKLFSSLLSSWRHIHHCHISFYNHLRLCSNLAKSSQTIFFVARQNLGTTYLSFPLCTLS